MKTLLHAKQNKFEWIHLQLNNRMFLLSKPERSYKGPMLWYHPALLILENYTDVLMFFCLNQVIQDFNSYNSHATAIGLENMQSSFVNLLDVYKYFIRNEKIFVPHDEVYILSHPHYPFAYTVDSTDPDNIFTYHTLWDRTKVKQEPSDLTLD